MDGHTEDGTAEWRSELVDVSGMSVDELSAKLAAANEHDSILARALRRVAADLEEPGEPIAGFNSAL